MLKKQQKEIHIICAEYLERKLEEMNEEEKSRATKIIQKHKQRAIDEAIIKQIKSSKSSIPF